MIKKSKYNYILGIQCFATIDSGACIIRVNNEKNNSNVNSGLAGILALTDKIKD